MNLLKWLLILASVLAMGSFTACSSAKSKPDAAQAGSAPAFQAQSAGQSATAPTDPAQISCTRGSETRVLIVEKKGPGCSLDYTKASKTAAVASSVHGTKHCVKSAKKIRTKLEQAGFKCA